ncbi:MAG: carboxypeptidase regulatory-like domain-containing protein [Terriglobales bacterium]
MWRLVLAGALVALVPLFPLALAAHAQSATTGAVVGSVTDATGSAIPGANLTLTNTATNLARHQQTDLHGGYVFTNVIPGDYTLAVTMTGFQRQVITNLVVQVNKGLSVSPKLQVGSQTQTVEVTATAQAQLQTLNATVGNVIGKQSINDLPTQNHDVVELLDLQPGVMGTGSSARVNGAISDQNSVTLDGINISGQVIAGSGLNIESVPTPSDSVEEFRVGVANNGASFSSSSGGDVTLVGRRGTNNFHGSAYWYNENQHFDANTWTNNKQGFAITPLTDNRFGARVGGPIRKNKDFFFFNYEGRRFPQTTTITRLVPTASLRQGILSFRDAAGAVDQWNLASAQNCGPSGNAACDPRGLGISPSISKLYSEEPVGNDPSLGDGLNTTGFSAPVRTPENTDYEVLRLDHNFNANWQLHMSETYYRAIQINTTDSQVNFLGGTAVGTLQQPQRATMVSANLVGQLSPTLLNHLTIGFMRNATVSQPLSITAAAALENLPGTNTPDGLIGLQSSALNFPIDNGDSAARFQWTKIVDEQLTDTLSWLYGNHTYQMGFDVHRLPTTHVRNDAVVAGDSSLAAVLNPGTTINIPSADAPPTCTSALTTSCLPSADTSTWDNLYSTTLGMVDNVNVMAARDGSLKPLPFGTDLSGNAVWDAINFYASDSWRATPDLTIDYGFNYGWQTPPVERNQKQVLLEAAGTDVPLTAEGYLNAKAAAAEQGQFYNPTLAWVPVQYSGDNVFTTDYGDVAPHLGAAWNPGFTNGFLGSLFGDHKSVIRAGAGFVYDRTNMVQNVEIPMLGVGFGQVVAASAPLCNASATPGAGCDAAVGATGAGGNPALASFRVGEDGTIPVPAFGAVTNPQDGVIPGTNGALISFGNDYDGVVGRSLETDFTIQRQLGKNMVLELGWTGDFGRNLPISINLNNAPYMFRDNAGGQTFAQAYNAIEAQLQAGTAPGSVSAQPWFDDLVPGGTDSFVGHFSSLFNSALVSNIFQQIDDLRMAQSLPTFNNQQVGTLVMRTHAGVANYNDLFVTLRMNPTHGLNFDINYTHSKLLDNGAESGGQDSAGFFADSYNEWNTYGYSSSDEPNAINATYTWNLPHSSGNGWLNRLTAGWYDSGVFTYAAGTPMLVSEGSQVYGGGILLSGGTDAIPVTGAGSIVTGQFANQSSGGVATRGDTSEGGLGLNIFSNPAAVYNNFRAVQLGVDGRSGNSNPLFGFPSWDLNTEIGKSTQLTERFSLAYSLQAFNVFNHPTWNTPGLSLFGTGPESFGVLTGKSGNRTIVMGLRVSF